MALQFLSLPSELTMTKSVELMKKHKAATAMYYMCIILIGKKSS